MTDQVRPLLREATRALNNGDLVLLQDLCKRILAVDDKQADAWFFMSVVAEAARQIGQAIRLVDRALGIAPGNSEYLSQKARYHTLLNQRDEAIRAADAAFAAKPKRPLILDTLGVVYTKLGEVEKARDVFRRAVALTPDNPQFQFNLASAEQFLGDAEAARAAYEKAIELQPGFSRAHWALSELEKNRMEAGRFDTLKQMLGRSELASADELYLCHAISREYEKQGDYDEAFAYLQRGKQRRKAEVSYSPEQDSALFAAITQQFTRESVRPQAPGGDDAPPIFILGMPRSGTTLVEQIVNAHSAAHSLGELQEFARAVKAVSETRTPVVLDAEVIRAAAGADPARIGQAYLEMLGDRVQPGKSFIDKMPLNFLCVGFIMAALPQAKVVCLQRNPLDTILSNYRQLFALDFSYYNYHYDLADTARFYVQFHALMQHWQSLYGERFYQVDYEALTADPEPQAQALLSYLDLPWEPQVLQFHKSTDAVTTASTMQVRQPLYRSSVGRWRKYEAQLAPAIAVLEASGIAFRES